MQQCLDVISEYGRKWRCNFNSSKSQIVIHCPRKNADMVLKLSGIPLNIVRNYKYLGIEIQNRLNWKIYKRRILCKAVRITTMIKAIWKINNKVKTMTMSDIWNSLVRPILEYGAEIWGFKRRPAAETLHRSFGRFLLGHRRNSSNGAVYGDLD